MATLKVITDYSNVTEGELDNVASAIYSRLATNANFT